MFFDYRNLLRELFYTSAFLFHQNPDLRFFVSPRLRPDEVIFAPHGLHFELKSPYMDRRDHIFMVKNLCIDNIFL